MSISIEKAALADLDTIFKIEKECFALEAFSKQHLASLLRNPNSLSLLAKLDTEIAGFMIALIHELKKEKIGHIHTVNVVTKAREMGVGFRLLEEAERILKEEGVKDCYLEVRMDNIPARKLYQKLGYIEVGELRDFYYPGGHGIKLKKEL
jgi:ribosomal-protein-alanine acetyltransferase